MSTHAPFDCTDLSVIASIAGFDNRPDGLASTTTPRALASRPIIVLPSATTGADTVASNVSPGLLLRLETAVSKITWISVPAGMVTGSGAGALCAGAEADELGCASALLGLLALLAVFALFPLLEHPAKISPAHNTAPARTPE